MDIGAWLRSLGLERYEAAFCENAIEADVLCYLTDQDLEKVGVLLGDRLRLLRATMDDDPTPLVVGRDESRDRSGALLPSEAIGDGGHRPGEFCNQPRTSY